MGSGSLLSIKLGQKKNDEASQISSTAFYTALGIGLVIAVFGNSFASFVLKLVGASESVLPYAKGYARYIFFGAPFMCASFVLNNDLRSEGKAFFSMIALTSGGLLNVLLDPFFIFEDQILFGFVHIRGFGLGIGGAAIATLISQLMSFCILLSWYVRRKVICSMNPKYYTFRVLGKIIATGIPSLARQGMASIASILLNTAAGTYGGDAAIAAMSIVTKICMFIASIMIGIGQGFSPVSGYNYGAKRYDRVKKAFAFMIVSGSALMSLLTLVCVIWAPQIMEAFIKDDAESVRQVVAVGTVALRWQAAFMPLHPLIIGTNMLMQSTRHVKSATYLSMNRQGIYFIPAILILPLCFGLFGVEICQFVADLLSAVTAIPFLIWFFRGLNKLQDFENRHNK